MGLVTFPAALAAAPDAGFYPGIVQSALAREHGVHRPARVAWLQAVDGKRSPCPTAGGAGTPAHAVGGSQERSALAASAMYPAPRRVPYGRAGSPQSRAS